MIVEFYPDKDSFGCNNLKSLIDHLDYYQTTNEILYGRQFVEFKFITDYTPNAIFVTDVFELNKNSVLKFSERNVIIVETLNQFKNIIQKKLLDFSKKYYVISESYWDENEYQFEDVNYTLLYYSWELNDFQNRITNRNNVYHHLNYIDVPNQYNPSYDFLCLAGRSKPWRNVFIDRLQCKIDVSNSLTSYFGKNLGHVDLLDIDVKYSRDQNNFEKEFYSPNKDFRYSYVLSYFTKPDLFSKTKFSIVVETEAENNEYHITEKTLKCLITGHPFVVIGTYNYLKFLRGLGFRTWADEFSENYDNILSLHDRIDTVIATVKELVNINFSKQKIIENQQHNLQTLCKLREDKFYQKFISTFND